MQFKSFKAESNKLIAKLTFMSLKLKTYFLKKQFTFMLSIEQHTNNAEIATKH